MVGVAHSVRASDCGPEGSRFDPDHPPRKAVVNKAIAFFVNAMLLITLFLPFNP